MPNYSVSFRAMGSLIQVWLNVPEMEEAQVLPQVRALFEAWEETLSRFRPTSELCALNARAGEWVSVSSVLFDNVAAAVDAAEMTGGLVNPLVLPALESAGYDRDFDPQTFTPGENRPASPVADWREIGLDGQKSRVRLPIGSRIDLGGTAKGWAAQQTANWMSTSGPCLVDAGGDLVARGSPDDLGGWLVSVGESEEPDSARSVLLKDAAIATSGIDYRRWERDGKTLHHLIDPRTGQPAESGILSATVIAPDAVQAEAWAKATLISGTLPEHFPALAVRLDGSRYFNDQFSSLWREYHVRNVF